MVNLLLESGLPYNGGHWPGAQTERRGDAGPVVTHRPLHSSVTK
jgi:hypothetical protein